MQTSLVPPQGRELMDEIPTFSAAHWATTKASPTVRYISRLIRNSPIRKHCYAGVRLPRAGRVVVLRDGDECGIGVGHGLMRLARTIARCIVCAIQRHLLPVIKIIEIHLVLQNVSGSPKKS